MTALASMAKPSPPTDRGPTGVAIEWREVAAQLAQIEEAMNPAQQVIGRYVIVEIE